MCHIIFLATQNPVPFQKFSSENFRMEDGSIENNDFYFDSIFVKNNLSLPNWYNIFISPNDTCSCGFRVHEKEIGFTEKLDWFPEDETALLSTQALFRALKELLNTNERVEILPTWNGDLDAYGKNDFEIQIYSISNLQEHTFCLFDNVKFIIEK